MHCSKSPGHMDLFDEGCETGFGKELANQFVLLTKVVRATLYFERREYIVKSSCKDVLCAIMSGCGDTLIKINHRRPSSLIKDLFV